MVKQLIMTQKRRLFVNFLRAVFELLKFSYFEGGKRKAKIEIADLKARLGLPVSSVQTIIATPKTSVPSAGILGQSELRKPMQAQKHVVQKGDSLYAISRKFYGDSSFIDFIFQANRSSLPSRIV